MILNYIHDLLLGILFLTFSKLKAALSLRKCKARQLKKKILGEWEPLSLNKFGVFPATSNNE